MASSTKMNSDLARERNQAAFSVERMTNLLDGGNVQTKRRRHLEAVIATDPTGIFSNDDNAYMHRTDRHVRALAKMVRLVELCRKLGIGDECGGEITKSKDFNTVVAALADDLPTMLHWGMFVPNIVTLCDEEQQAKWLPMCRDWRMIGCYAQTELGHGSNVRALETTAVFLPENRGGQPGGSFLINSPTITSAKFWPGTLGRTANHAMVIAQLTDGDGVDRGIHNFLVPLRCMDDHKPLKGVTTGDIGPKIGYNNMDNGYARFENVIIPRRNMAMRFASVSERGIYSKKSVSDATSKVAYITMMQIRAYIISEAGKALSMACTISIRYSAVRKQGFHEDGKKELQILDYKQQQHRLLTSLAASYCFFFTGRKVLKDIVTAENRIVSGGNITKTEVADIHASTSALKSFTTTVAADGMEDCRKACGGHGFLQCSGLAELVTSYLQNPTVEGDNHMLPQQVVKVLLKLVQAIQCKDDLSDYSNCDQNHLIPSLKIILSGKTEHCEANSASDICELPALLKAFRHRAARLLVEAAQQLQTHAMAGKTTQEAWNDTLIQMARVSRAYSLFLLLHNFAINLEVEARESTVGPNEIDTLRELAVLFGLYWMEREMGDFLEDGYLSSEQAPWVRTNVLKFLDIVRPNAVSLVDARDFSDFRLKSALGRFDGNVYPYIMDAAKRDPLNQTEPGPGYEQHLKRLTKDGVGVYTGTASRL